MMQKSVNLLPAVEKTGLLSFLAEAGLLTKAEKAGLFSSLEAAGAFSTAEKALPVLEKLGLLSLVQDVIETDAGTLSTAGAALIAAAPLYAALDVAGVVPTPEGALLALAVLGGLATTAAGAALLPVANIASILQSAEE
jgi:hypothetical protein